MHSSTSLIGHCSGSASKDGNSASPGSRSVDLADDIENARLDIRPSVLDVEFLTRGALLSS